MEFDAIVIGTGPNGLAAAIEVAQAGWSVGVVEAGDTVGGGARSAELTLPGFIHDVCSGIHPLGVASPFFRSLPLERYGLEWIHPPIPLAHPLDDGTAALLERWIDQTAAHLGKDAAAYSKLFESFVRHWEEIVADVLAPPIHMPRRPLAMVRFGLNAIQPAASFAARHFQGEGARALFTGMAAHANMPLHLPPTAGFGLLLGILGHAVGWPMARGGSQKISDALAAHLTALGGRITTGTRIRSLSELPPARVVICDLTPREILRIAGDRLPSGYRRTLERYRYGPGVFKMDWALSAPIPWRAAASGRAGTLHIGGTIAEMTAAEAMVSQGSHPDRPFVILAQHSLFDETRAPQGKHTAWAYCHVPNGSTFDMTERIEAQIERFAPGFRDCILARHRINTVQLEAYNPNCAGGDISGGIQTIRQVIARPSLRVMPYRTPLPELFICSSATPPGGGVHGMCGYYAARAALDRIQHHRGL